MPPDCEHTKSSQGLWEVAQRKVDFGQFRMYQAYMVDSQAEMNIFYERDLAIEWLSLSKFMSSIYSNNKRVKRFYQFR